MKTSYLKKDKGFTLMETLIYIALFGILMSGAVIGVYNLIVNNDHNILENRIQEEGTFINRKINWALTGATAISVDGGGTIITITRPLLGLQSPLRITNTGGVIYISRGTGISVALTSDRFNAHDLFFVYTAGVNGRPPSVYISFFINDKQFTFRNYLRQ